MALYNLGAGVGFCVRRGPHVEDEESTIPIGSRVSSAAGQGHDPAPIITCVHDVKILLEELFHK